MFLTASVLAQECTRVLKSLDSYFISAVFTVFYHDSLRSFIKRHHSSTQRELMTTNSLYSAYKQTLSIQHPPSLICTLVSLTLLFICLCLLVFGLYATFHSHISLPFPKLTPRETSKLNYTGMPSPLHGCPCSPTALDSPI